MNNEREKKKTTVDLKFIFKIRTATQKNYINLTQNIVRARTIIMNKNCSKKVQKIM